MDVKRNDEKTWDDVCLEFWYDRLKMWEGVCIFYCTHIDMEKLITIHSMCVGTFCSCQASLLPQLVKIRSSIQSSNQSTQ